MLANFQREYNINRIFLSSIGLWPFQNKIMRNVLRTFCILLEISYYPFELILLYDHWDDSKLVFDGLYQITMSVCFFARIINQLWNHEKLQKLYLTMDEHWDIFTNETDVRVLKDYSTLSRKFTIYFSILVYIMTSAFIIVPLTPIFLDFMLPLNESRPRFFAIEIEFRLDKNEYFLPLYFYTTTAIVVGITIVVAVDAMHITCTTHACSLFASVSQQVENMILKVNNNNKISDHEHCMNTEFESLEEEIMYREYITCLKKHQLAIEFVDILESTYQGFSICLLLLIIAILSLIGVRIVDVLDQVGEVTRFTFLIIGDLVVLLIVCYPGQRLMDESQDVFHRAYAAEWYNYSPRLKYLLLMTLYRSNIPCGLKAGNMIPLSIATYAASFG
ncbi:odorant receptor 63a isoform X3 [Ooceraea biroi]|uniref:odorant receptor 63a isoform X3 n=1 Tax=Ooceraea biroi TaxID=2015173 RepID=UPI000F08596E|nr:odorant receptor 63a isoform X3 [Ooceraea biroi]XP_026826857.1 odorant receptor 63a isoform X3 [Ooceraea biroi]